MIVSCSVCADHLVVGSDRAAAQSVRLGSSKKMGYVAALLTPHNLYNVGYGRLSVSVVLKCVEKAVSYFLPELHQILAFYGTLSTVTGQLRGFTHRLFTQSSTDRHHN